MARTQGERRSHTCARLLAAAAAVFAERGVEGASVDAIADAADRTSGALYAHFGSKQGLLFEVLDSWMNDMAVVVAAELIGVHTLDEQLGALWRNVVSPERAVWLRLEHELWRWATRSEETALVERLAARYRYAQEALAEAIGVWAAQGEIGPPLPPGQLAPMVIGLIVGLEMQHRVDPSVANEHQAVTAIRALIGAPARRYAHVRDPE